MKLGRKKVELRGTIWESSSIEELAAFLAKEEREDVVY